MREEKLKKKKTNDNQQNHAHITCVADFSCQVLTHHMIRFGFMVSNSVLKFFFLYLMLKHSYAWSSESSESPNSPLSLSCLASEDRLETTGELEIDQVETSVDFEHESKVPPSANLGWVIDHYVVVYNAIVP